MAGFGNFLSMIGIGADIFMNYWGISEERKQQQMYLGLYSKTRAEDLRMEQERMGLTRQQIDIQKKRLAEEKRQAAKMWKWKEEEQNYTRARDVVDRFTGVLDRGPAFKNNLVNLWPKYSMRRAA